MKSLLLVLVCLLWIGAAKAQYQLATLVSNKIIQLKGKMQRKGQKSYSRFVVPINLPQGTIGVCYTITGLVSRKSVDAGYSLADSLLRLIDISGDESVWSAESALEAPQGAIGASVFFIRTLQSAEEYLAANDNFLGFIREFSRENVSRALVVAPLSGPTFMPERIFLGLEDPNPFYPVSVVLNVVAIVDPKRL